jgi:hypothetical protein
MPAGRRRPRATTVIAAAVVAAVAAGAVVLSGLLPGIERGTVSQRFERRDPFPPRICSR